MRTKTNDSEILLSDALRKAKGMGWAHAAIRDAVVRGEIPSRRSSTRKRARYYVKWSSILHYAEALRVY